MSTFNVELTIDTTLVEKVNLCVECGPCDLFIEGNTTRHLHHHIDI